VPHADVLELLASDVASPVHSTGMLVVCGTRMAREDVLALAGMLARDGSDRTARILLGALVRGRDFVALTADDKERVLAVLDHPPEALVPLRGTLFDELNWQRSGLVPPPRTRGIAAAIGHSDGDRSRVAWV
jgi:hypothetical protein